MSGDNLLLPVAERQGAIDTSISWHDFLKKLG